MSLNSLPLSLSIHRGHRRDQLFGVDGVISSLNRPGSTAVEIYNACLTVLKGMPGRQQDLSAMVKAGCAAINTDF